MGVEEQAASLNSGDAFLLRTPDQVYAWLGNGCNDAEIASAMKIGESLQTSTVFRKTEQVKEGEEPDKFWQFLGGKGEYASEKELQEAPRDPRLFQCSDASGTFRVEEIHDFAQDDLDSSDVFLLDVFSELYVWVGSEANDYEKKEGQAIAQKFLDASPSSADTSIVLTKQGQEPPMFTSAFLGWDASKAAVFEDPYEAKLRKLAAEKAGDDDEPAPAAEATKAVAQVAIQDPSSSTYTLAELQGKCPAGVDAKKKEQYLSDEEFQKVFKMSKDEFAKQKGWKQQSLKKAQKLF